MEENAGKVDEKTGYLPFHALPVVGLGGSAGSLAPLQEFFRKMRADTGMAFVVIIHLSPEHESRLAQILQASTSMPVIQVRERTAVKPNHVYVIPPGRHLSMVNGHLDLTDFLREVGRRVAVDYFFRTLADTHGPNSVAVVLSGADSDGAIGIKRIKERGGLTIAQEPQESEHRGMPQSAIETNLVDWVLRAGEMPAKIAEYHVNGRRVALPNHAEMPSDVTVTEAETATNEAGLRDVLSVLRARTGRDFNSYKRGTIVRRVARRMQVHGLEQLGGYHAYLRMHPGETGALMQDLLISVTNFFRDREAFNTLKQAIPQLFKGKGAKDIIRVWVPACATGEEAYSIAMLLHEYAATLSTPPKLQVFASDLDENAIAAARIACYPETIVADVSEERLRHFFVRQPDGYRINLALRETVLFATHDLLKDPPFSHLDLISCRNLLIYLNREAQSRIFEVFHFALRPEALLFLGTSESAEDATDLFTAENKKHRLYRRSSVPRPGLQSPLHAVREVHVSPIEPLVLPQFPSHPPDATSVVVAPARTDFSMGELHFKFVEYFAPASLLVNRDNQIAHLSTRAGRYLQFTGGEPTADLLSVVHPTLRVELRAAVFRAREHNVAAETADIPVDFETATRHVHLVVRPVPDLAPGFLLITFEEREVPAEIAAPARPVETEGAIRSLERELESTKRVLRTVQEQHSASTEEMKASNEERQAMNEELRSASEELETSREELQSVNEELITVNQDLKSKVDELARANGDLQNLMAATNIATVFLDRDLRVKRYTPSAITLFNLIATDIGRPLLDLRHRLEFDTVLTDAETVLQTASPVEREVRAATGRWYLAAVIPYRNPEDHVMGVVLTFVDITRRRQAEDSLRESTQELERRVRERTSELHEANEKLQKEFAVRKRAEAEREKIMQALVNAQEAERGRISRELHDEIGQRVTALLLGLKEITAPLAGNKRAEETLRSLRGITESIGRDIHQVAVELRPTSLTDLGLVCCLANFIEERMAAAGVAVDLDYEEFGAERFPETVEITLYRILCEALHNVFRHARATRAAVILRRERGRVVGIVEDNGIGFVVPTPEQHTPAKHLGLVGMRERVMLVDGELSIESEPGNGTTVIVRLPLPADISHD